MRSKRTKPTPKAEPSQIQKFRQAARQVETDDGEAAFDGIVKKVGRLRRDPRIIGEKAE